MVHFKIDDCGIESYVCSFCAGPFEEDKKGGIAFLSKDNMICCTPICAQLREPGDIPGVPRCPAGPSKS